jgi:flavin reductase (DIM6/NTAB) family NADH-FMN oxidoreductase RutF
MQIDLQQALKRCSKPERVCLIVTYDEKNSRSNIITVGWKMWTSLTPRMLAFSIAPTRYSHELLIKEKQCVIAWPGPDMLKGVLLCGTASGVNVDKFKATGWTALPASQTNASLIKEGVVNLECKIEDSVSTGDHTLFIAAVLQGYVSEDDRKILFTIKDELHFKHLGSGKGYKFGVFS